MLLVFSPVHVSTCAQIFSPSCTFFLSFTISQISPHQLMVTDVSSLRTSSVSLSTRSLHRCVFILLCGFLWKCHLTQHFSQTVNKTSAWKVLTLYLSSCYTLYKCSTLRSLTELKPLPHFRLFPLNARLLFSAHVLTTRRPPQVRSAHSCSREAWFKVASLHRDTFFCSKIQLV